MRSFVFLKSMAAKKRYKAGHLENAIAEMQGEEVRNSTNYTT